MSGRLTRLSALVGAGLVTLSLAGCAGTPPCGLCDAIDARDVAGLRALLDQGEPVTAAALEQAADPIVILSRTGGD